MDHTVSWYCLSCGDPTLCVERIDQIRQAFEQLHRSAGLADGAAILSRHESSGGVHCELVLYFTPEAEPVACTFEALACNKPTHYGLSVLVSVNTNAQTLLSSLES